MPFLLDIKKVHYLRDTCLMLWVVMFAEWNCEFKLQLAREMNERIGKHGLCSIDSELFVNWIFDAFNAMIK